jgi:hypothetical protein
MATRSVVGTVGAICKIESLYLVASATGSGTVYTVSRKAQGHWTCSCPAAFFYARKGPCKHVRKIVAMEAGGDLSTDGKAVVAARAEGKWFGECPPERLALNRKRKSFGFC